jgi:hypothetical protein
MPAEVDGIPAEYGLAMPMESPTAIPIVTGGTIPTNMYVVRLAPAGAVTGIILAPGTKKGQSVIVINEAIAANSVTFAAAPGGGVSNGVTSVLAGLLSREFIWDTVTALWYPQV